MRRSPVLRVYHGHTVSWHIQVYTTSPVRLSPERTCSAPAKLPARPASRGAFDSFHVLALNARQLHQPPPPVALQRPIQISEKQDRFTWFLRLATFALVVAILRFAEDVLIPVALAALLAFLLTPMVVRLG